MTRADEPVPLGGFVKRGLLSLLLLHSNRVVPTSHLLNALWPSGTPATARKMLQNAVSDLRRIMNEEQAQADAPILLTHPPGYLLRVSAKDVDLSRFQQLAAAGRASLAEGDHESARKTLRAALGLQRGPILSELAEEGVVWPEIEALENFVLNVREDCFETELALGRHRAVLEEMENLHMSHPSRERLSGQLMVGLYRCGRQLDALALYQRIRSLLDDEFGLEPGHDLKALQTAIITQDPALSLPPTVPPARQASSRDVLLHPSVGGTPAAPRQQRHDGVIPLPLLAADRKPELISVVMVKIQVSSWDGDPTPEETVEIVHNASVGIHREFEKNNGTIRMGMGEISFSFFRGTDVPRDHANRAMRAATAIHRHFGAGTLSGVAGHRYTVSSRIAVATGEAVLQCGTGGGNDLGMTVIGGVMDRCTQLLRFTSPGEIRVCKATHQATRSEYAVAHEPVGGWKVLAPLSSRGEARVSDGLHEVG
ncbi:MULTISPECIES: BTAD domain-containing putative transcriptional regulator [unclassified Streptomyces]|uniref:BTAD domain-containing putative transcriptional regulator n=1 Tax=unclassified Streptomyces TaxID=2593676 RepID=UPI00382867D7|nr:winged helix-turn-helix domain-containing protein [Streptomyces sp. NBC_01176]